MIFKEKYFSSYLLLLDQIPLSGFLLLLEILGNIRVVVFCRPGCDVIKLEINLIFLIKPFFLNDQKVKTKI